MQVVRYSQYSEFPSVHMNKHLVSSGSEDGFEILERRITYRFALIASQIGSALAPSHIERYGMALVHGYRWDRGYPNPAGA